MSLVLGFDTSGPYISAVLLRDGVVLADLHEEMEKGQVEALFPLLEDVLARGGATWQDLSALGVGVGPGNFTGIRLSVSAARGLSLSLEIPAVGVSQLDALAYGSSGPRLAALNARRAQVYVQSFDMKTALLPQVISVEDVPEAWREEGLVCIGSGAQAVADKLGVEVRPANYAPGSAVARIASERWRETREPPKPLYLRAADAAPSREKGPVILDDA